MIWLITIASLLGFLAVDKLVDYPYLTNYDDHVWLQLVLGLLILLLITFGLAHWLYRRVRNALNPTLTLKIRLISLMVASLIFVLTLLLSASYGVYQYQRYQNSLLKMPITVDALVRSYQISDTLNQTITLSNTDYTIGNGYTRQILQVTINNDHKSYDALTSSQPLTALVTANIKDNPSWQQALLQLKPGQQLKVKLQLQPIHHLQSSTLPKNAKTLNLGFDEAQWLRQRGVQAKATLLTMDQNSLSDFKPSTIFSATRITIEEMRWQLRQQLLSNLHQSLVKQSLTMSKTANMNGFQADYQYQLQNYAILLGLLTGDKALMDSQLKNLYQVTGISHLLAISGPHVLMLATMVSMLLLWLVKVAAPTLFAKLPSRLLVLWVSVVVAGFYAMLVGFEIPAQRTFWMLLLLTLSQQLLLRTSVYRLLAGVALGMIWLDTTAVGQAGFWLSFVAVALLVVFSEQVSVKSAAESAMFGQLGAVKSTGHLAGYFFRMMVNQLVLLLKIQLWLFIWMLPIVVWFFGKVSLIGIIINLVAVPLLGLIIVPIDMLAGMVSWLPGIGDWISHTLWALLADLLGAFHHLLRQLVAMGFAKQAFVALSQTQLTVCVLIAIVWFLRGLLPRMLILPMGIVLLLIPVAQQAASNRHPTLAVMDNPKMGISLVKKGADSWLILADNQVELAKTPQTHFVKTNHGKAKQAASSLSTEEEISTILTRDIYPLLANQHINQLTGIISQTPSPKINQLIQQLASYLPIQQYWLAGYEAASTTTPRSDEHLSTRYPTITPKNCQTTQTWQHQGLVIKAISGWDLALPLTAEEKLASQTCFIQISYQSPTRQPYTATLIAGNSELPMQMSEKLCTASASNLLIQPYNAPINPSWLALTQPSLLHVLSGEADYQKLPEDSQLTLAGWQANQPSLQVIQSAQVGAVVYSLYPDTPSKN